MSVGAVFFTWRLHRSQPPLGASERGIVLDVIRKGDGIIGRVVAGVVMDDHVHALAALAQGTTIQRVIQTWKSASAHRLTKECGRTAPVWQRDYFDRSLRSEQSVRACITYILQNPARRWPKVVNYPWILPPSNAAGD
jgi:REP element-mobilizing transposase RayT